ncbi:hypothetical protein [Pontibacter akesuensis]|uniref:YD repeat-containing protein n=1 Tax=Pontibacter akesuensis TaxID=388950 RepID=A0A1I7GDR5_9BACT|nr:hypothetical protein [Pontibacter akesuensis]GHA57454.1 hypothetical protein GCM10007389_06440 [Pontibacter akesuensis]SFU46396.1 hypothetical protein SAMN04487941_0927 [Pontibacter akesuensis]
MKTYLPLLCLLVLAACQQPTSEPTPRQEAEVLCFPLTVTSASPEGVNEVFYYTSYGELYMREYFTRTDTVHYFEEFLLGEREAIGVINNRRHSPADTVVSYHTIDRMDFNNLPVRRNKRPVYPQNTLLLDGYEVYTYNAQYELQEQQFYTNYRLTETYKYTHGNNNRSGMEVFDATGAIIRSYTLTYDNQRFPHASNPKYQTILIGLGYPHAHNMLQVEVRDATGQLLPAASYSNAYTYNS